MQTPKLGHAPITLRRRDSEENLERRGDFCWLGGEDGKRTLVIAMPCDPRWRDNTKGGEPYSMCRWSIGYKNHSGAQWSWDGDEDKPTLSPSLHWVGVWHGYVENGVMREA